jgi:hypothetical protein
MAGIEEYIRQAARARGIDPDIAVRVARSEGGLKDPYRRGEGPAPRSQRYGGTEHSFGPFQLYLSGNNAGLGDRALAAGIDPRKDWQGGIDFALNEAAQKGWGQWYGAAKAGIGNRDGIGGARGITINSGPQMAALPEPGQMAPPILGGRNIEDRPVAGVLAAPTESVTAATPDASPWDVFKADGVKAGLNAAAENTKVGKGFDTLLSAMGGGSSRDAQAEAHAVPIQSSLPALEAVDATRMAQAQQLMQSVLAAKRKKVPGLSLMG